jgi:DNA-binding CsgD family transcriptional regulator
MRSVIVLSMSIWQFIQNWRMGLRQKNKKYHFILGEPLSFELVYSATQENLKKLESNSLAVSPLHDLQQDELYQRWILLSPREQDVTALTCLRFTNPQIAARLGLSKETVKTYLQKVSNKFGLQSKADLRVMFANWDFSAWERGNPHR